MTRPTLPRVPPGESILVCRECDRANALHLMTSRLPPISSCLTSSGTASEPLRRAVLEVIVSGVAGSREDVALFASCTLPANGPDSSPEQSRSVPEPPPRDGAVGECLGWLIEHEFVRCAEDGSLSATQLGSAALASSLGPADSLAVIAELQRARRCFVLESELHLVYLVTPVYCGDLWPQMDWLNYLTMLEALPAAERRVAELVSVEQRFIVRALKGTVNPRQPRQAAQLVSHKRFYTALALHELINGAPLRRTADKFGCNRGALQALQQSAATFAGMVTSFCGRLGWRCLELLLDQFQSRLEFGVPPELVPLVRLSLVNGLRARALRRAGMERLIQVANSSAQRVEAALRNATPFQSATDEEADPALLAVSGGTQICVDGCRYIPVAEAAREIVLEARKLVESDLGMTGIAWGTGEAVLDGDSSQHRLSDNEALNFSSQSNTDLFDSFEIDSRSAAGLGSTGKKDCIVPRGTGGPAAWPEVCEVSGPGADWCQLKEASLGRWRRVCLALAVERETPRAGRGLLEGEGNKGILLCINAWFWYMKKCGYGGVMEK
ncbi:DNA polymerase theta [Amphibalanus amphitrite]|uniref:DNA polymerase theta n=1 Tax=Amphibalanus amphitrite TaxID=1232801 RepID=A0A6A4VA71_AMPAM|nr:DNA polymerase theta [Amphibalanus amphitrite]